MGEAGGGRGEAEGWQAEQEGPAVHQPPAWPASRRVCDTQGERGTGSRERGEELLELGEGGGKVFPPVFRCSHLLFFPAVSERVIKMLW